MLAHERVRINPDQIVHEMFEGEVLAINLNTGTYYSLTGPSSQLWSILAAGGTVGTIIQHFTAEHDGDPGVIATAVSDFLERLRSERLIVTDETSGDSDLLVRMPSSTMKTPFAPLEMTVFTDMQDLLLLDPIHDVADAGWPLAKPHAAEPEKL